MARYHIKMANATDVKRILNLFSNELTAKCGVKNKRFMAGWSEIIY